MYKQSVVFGVFDGLHEGHKHFLQGAKDKTQKLIVVVAIDSAVHSLKGKYPRRTLQERESMIREFDQSFEVVTGDEVAGEWSVFKTHHIDAIFLGHDQNALENVLKNHNIPILYIDAHEPETYKSSKMP